SVDSPKSLSLASFPARSVRAAVPRDGGAACCLPATSAAASDPRHGFHGDLWSLLPAKASDPSGKPRDYARTGTRFVLAVGISAIGFGICKHWNMMPHQ
ncbi:unnamed protein product, partial [Urochloa humidicola]